MRLGRPFRITAFVIAIAALVAGAALATSQSVVIQNLAFNPPTATISVGESITWLNIDPVTHTATSDSGAFDTGAIAPNGNKTISFAVAGSYAYHCSIHPTLKGTIVVLGHTAAPAPPTPTRRATPPPTLPPTTTPPPSPSPSASASPSRSAAPTPAPTTVPTAIAVPTTVAAASPSAAVGAGPDLGSGPGPLIAAVGLALAAGLGGLALYLYRRR